MSIAHIHDSPVGAVPGPLVEIQDGSSFGHPDPIILNNSKNSFIPTHPEYLDLLERVDRLNLDLTFVNDRGLKEERWNGLKVLVGQCRRFGKKVRCPDDHEFTFRPKSCGNTRYCYRCGRTEASLRAEVVYERLLAISKVMDGPELISQVYTIPESLRVVVNADGGYNRLFNVVSKTLKKYFGGTMPINATLHPGSSKDLLLLNPHIDVVMLNLKHVLDRPGGDRFVSVSGYVDPGELRSVYLAELNKEFDTDYDEVNLFSTYVKWTDDNDYQVRHHINYSTRSFVQDVYESVGKGRVFSDIELPGLMNLLDPPINFHRRRPMGWLSCGYIAQRFHELGIDYETSTEIRNRIVDVDRCSVCNEPMVCDAPFDLHDLHEVGYYRSTEEG